ncbi:MAG: hypothetical protein LBV50_04875, partial [Novosphingobium sp.]|jgi:hypothetical protein|nr:hypothetical protein [Novosphingobium sp.]
LLIFGLGLSALIFDASAVQAQSDIEIIAGSRDDRLLGLAFKTAQGWAGLAYAREGEAYPMCLAQSPLNNGLYLTISIEESGRYRYILEPDVRGKGWSWFKDGSIRVIALFSDKYGRITDMFNLDSVAEYGGLMHPAIVALARRSDNVSEATQFSGQSINWVMEHPTDDGADFNTILQKASSVEFLQENYQKIGVMSLRGSSGIRTIKLTCQAVQKKTQWRLT